MDLGEIAANAGAGSIAFKTATEGLVALKQLVTGPGAGKITEIQAALIDAQQSAINAQFAHSAQVQRIRALEAEIASYETWDTEKRRYELKGVWGGGLAYMLKPEERGTEPPHWLCPSCYEQRKKGFFQPFGNIGRDHVYKCSTCQTPIKTNTEPQWD